MGTALPGSEAWTGKSLRRRSAHRRVPTSRPRAGSTSGATVPLEPPSPAREDDRVPADPTGEGV